MIRFDSVTKRYPDGTVAVDGLSFEAPSGQITVLVGPSGCGKTTSLRMINRMIEPTSGRILLDGQDTAGFKAAELRRGMGYVIQHAGLFPHRTIVFVTHDIDEAIKLGDRVAVMRAGGKLAQFAPPAELLSYPADAFVAGFVGRDRGYRALGFAVADHLPISPEPAVPLGADLSDAA